MINHGAGDEITIEVADPRHFWITRDPRRDEALETLRTLGWCLLTGFCFDRDEANARRAIPPFFDANVLLYATLQPDPRLETGRLLSSIRVATDGPPATVSTRRRE